MPGVRLNARPRSELREQFFYLCAHSGGDKHRFFFAEMFMIHFRGKLQHGGDLHLTNGPIFNSLQPEHVLPFKANLRPI